MGQIEIMAGQGGYDIIAGGDEQAILAGDNSLIQARFAGRPAAFASALLNLSRRGVGPAMTLPNLNAIREVTALQNNLPMVVQDKPVTVGRKIPFGFGPTTVASGASTTFTLTPAANFKPDRLSIPQAAAPQFAVTTFLIGQESMLLNGNAVPCESFSDLAYNPDGWKLTTIQVGQPAILVFQNISGADAIIRGCFWGFAAY